MDKSLEFVNFGLGGTKLRKRPKPGTVVHAPAVSAAEWEEMKREAVNMVDAAPADMKVDGVGMSSELDADDSDSDAGGVVLGEPTVELQASFIERSQDFVSMIQTGVVYRTVVASMIGLVGIVLMVPDGLETLQTLGNLTMKVAKGLWKIAKFLGKAS